MLEKIRFVLGWVKYNRSMTFVYITVLSFIACSNLLLMQFFYNESTYDENGTYFYCFYFDKSMKLETAEKILNDLDKSGIDVLEYAVAVIDRLRQTDGFYKTEHTDHCRNTQQAGADLLRHSLEVLFLVTAHSKQHRADCKQEYIAGEHNCHTEDQPFRTIHGKDQRLTHKDNVAVNTTAAEQPQFCRLHLHEFAHDEEHQRTHTAHAVSCQTGDQESLENFRGIIPLQQNHHITGNCHAGQDDGKTFRIGDRQHILFM